MFNPKSPDRCCNYRPESLLAATCGPATIEVRSNKNERHRWCAQCAARGLQVGWYFVGDDPEGVLAIWRMDHC